MHSRHRHDQHRMDVPGNITVPSWHRELRRCGAKVCTREPSCCAFSLQPHLSALVALVNCVLRANTGSRLAHVTKGKYTYKALLI